MEKELQEIVSRLSFDEREIIPFLNLKNAKEIAEKSGIDEIKVKRALEFLSNKDVLKIRIEKKKEIMLGDNGILYLKQGLPERKLLNLLVEEQSISLKDAKEKSRLSENEFAVALGILKEKNFLEMNGMLKTRTREVAKKMPEEKFLEKLPCGYAVLDEEEKKVLSSLLKRKNIIKITEKSEMFFELTEKGKLLLKNADAVKDAEFIEILTTEIIEKGMRGKKFRKYDIKSDVPKIYAGKKQPYKAFLDNVRKKFLALGFEEMFGHVVESNFWNMDVLFMPQFHSARDIHEAYYVKKQETAKDIPSSLLKKVKEAHEKGIAGSRGWRYSFDEELTKKLLLRTQGTALSARMLASEQLKIPGKYFSISRCFRPDVVDESHLTEFNQIEGIVVEQGLTLKHLFGLLKMIAKEFANAGEKETKIVPGYFPFTEPSAELFIKHSELGWVEIGGAGIFRPEMLTPLGIKVPVIAWGLGIDRIFMCNEGIKDIRMLFSHDLNFLRKAKI